MNERENNVRESRLVISDLKLKAFFRAARSLEDCLAVSLINEELDEGSDLDTIFYTGESDGYSLDVSEDGPDRFHIAFGCQAGPLAGDGGSWRVAFEGDAVTSIDPGLFWIS